MNQRHSLSAQRHPYGTSLTEVQSLIAKRRLGDFAKGGFGAAEQEFAHFGELIVFEEPLDGRLAAVEGDLGGFDVEIDRPRFDESGVVRAHHQTQSSVPPPPDDRPLSVRVSASDWLGEKGLTDADAVAIARALKEHGCDIVDVSSGGNAPESQPEYGRMYQVPFAERIRYEAGIPVMAVGAILGADHCNTVLAAERADLCCLARPHLGDPYLTLHSSETYGYADQHWPGQYLLGRTTRKD